MAARNREPATATLEIPEEPRAKRICLEVGEADGHECVLVSEGGRVSIGSGRGNDIVLGDRTVSGRHCVVRSIDGRVFVDDLGSRNGVYVGGAKVCTAQLEPGACFVVGRVSIVVRSGTTSQGHRTTPLPRVVGESPAMMRVAEQVRRLAPLSVPVLVRGPTGAGKDLIARALHDLGPRAGGPFVALNVGALPRDLAAAELFGHERGAFTGAFAKRDGAFVAANGGTLFLDEVGELSHDVQVKLLRALEEGEVRAIGASKAARLDVRVVAATWAPLEQRIEQREFRLDLYHRLAVGCVTLPPLADRRSDIPALVEHFLKLSEAEVGRKRISSAALACLVAHPWPGNIRQLRNVVVRAALLAARETIGPTDVDNAIHEQPAPAARLTRDAAIEMVRKCSGKVSAAARACGVPRSTFRGWLQEEEGCEA